MKTSQNRQSTINQQALRHNVFIFIILTPLFFLTFFSATVFQVLTRELNYTKAQARTLRHDKRFHAPTTPLLFVEWWRLCLDEAQMVEGSSCLAAEMAKKFSAINKWAITGTPIQKAVNGICS